MTDRALSDDDLQRLWDEAKDAGGGTWTFARLVEQAAIESERAQQAEPKIKTLLQQAQESHEQQAEPVVWISPDALKRYAQGHEVVLFPLVAEGDVPLYAAPPADDEAVRLLREAQWLLGHAVTRESVDEWQRRKFAFKAENDAYLAGRKK